MPIRLTALAIAVPLLGCSQVDRSLTGIPDFSETEVPQYAGEDIAVIVATINYQRDAGSPCEDERGLIERDGETVIVSCLRGVYEVKYRDAIVLLGTAPSRGKLYKIAHGVGDYSRGAWIVSYRADGRLWALDEGNIDGGEACFHLGTSDPIRHQLESSGRAFEADTACFRLDRPG